MDAHETARAEVLAATPAEIVARFPPGHEDEDTAHAPGDLEHVRSFLSLHDHAEGSTNSVAPSTATLDRWMRGHQLLGLDERVDDADLRPALEVLEALRALVDGAEHDAVGDPDQILDANARAAAIHLRFGDARLEPTSGGVPGAVGRLLAIAFLSQRDGTWDRLHGCASPTCRSVFFDRSKNRSARWCSMRSCGNQAKVRAYRERHKAPTA
jgi:hypothetical protein